MNADPTDEKFIALRVGAILCALALSASSVEFVRGALKSGFAFFSPIFALILGTAAAICWWCAFRGHIAEDRAVIASVLTGALIVGCISFVIGIFGPMHFMPKSNQGPLIGIFVTGPLGLIAGGLIGLIVGIVRVFF